MIGLAISIILAVIYSIAGARHSWMRSYLICPLLAIITAVYVRMHNMSYMACLWGLFLAIAYSMSYGYNSPVRRFVRLITGDDDVAIVFARISYSSFISLAAIPYFVYTGTWLWIIVHGLLNIVIGSLLGIFNPFSKLKLGNFDPTRIEEFLVGLLSIGVPLWLLK